MKHMQTIASVLLGAAVALPLGLQAQTTEEKTEVNNPKRVVVERTKSTLEVTIEGKEGHPNYRYHNTFQLGQNETLNETEDTREWNFNLPFIKNGKVEPYNKAGASRKYSSPHTEGVNFGLVTALGAPDNMDVDMLSSYEIGWTICSLTAHSLSRKNRWNYAISFGLNWKNYRMTDWQRFVHEGANLTVGSYPVGATPKFSRLKIFSLTVPCLVGYSLTRRAHLELGPVINFNTYGSLKTRWRDADGNKCKEFDKDIHQQPITIDLMGRLSLDNVALYAKYTPMPVLRKAFAPEFRGLSVGVMIGY